MASIYERQKLKPSQLVTVAERRFADAEALCDTGKNVHANGAQYLCGFVIEMLLKARLMQRYSLVASKPPHAEMSQDEQRIWSLIYRSHDLREMLDRLPQLEAALQPKGREGAPPYWQHLVEICANWTVHARYSPLSTTMAEARKLIERVRELKKVLK